MELKATFVVACCLVGCTFALSEIAVAQQGNRTRDRKSVV